MLRIREMAAKGRLDKEGSISQELLGVSDLSRYHKVDHDLCDKNNQ